MALETILDFHLRVCFFNKTVFLPIYLNVNDLG